MRKNKSELYYSCLLLLLAFWSSTDADITTTDETSTLTSAINQTIESTLSSTTETITTTTKGPNRTDWSHITKCPSNVQCNLLGPDCIECPGYTINCIYGDEVAVTCTAKPGLNCTGPEQFEKRPICRFCYQTEPWEHTCTDTTNCKVVNTTRTSNPRGVYISNCTVKQHILCLGHRTFKKRRKCNWTSGYRWSTTLILSVTLGGFGADRFYLGQWREGIGKLFSFGGLGVWTLVDVILVAVGYVGPHDGTLYIY